MLALPQTAAFEQHKKVHGRAGSWPQDSEKPKCTTNDSNFCFLRKFWGQTRQKALVPAAAGTNRPGRVLRGREKALWAFVTVLLAFSVQNQAVGSDTRTNTRAVPPSTQKLAWADSSSRDDLKKKDTLPEDKKSPVEGYRLQTFDQPLQLHEPLKPRSAADQKRIEATAWYMNGRFREKRNDFRGALEAYEKAVELDPRAVTVYRDLVPLAFALNMNEKAVQYALKAVELDPDDYQLLRRLGVHMAGQRKIPQAVQLLEKATQSPELSKTSGVYVTLRRDLGVLYSALGQNKKAAQSYRVVLDALSGRGDYELNAKTRSKLLAEPLKTYENMGKVFLAAEQPKLAIEAFERASKVAKGKPDNLSYNLARVYLQTEQLDKALGELQKYFDAQLQSKGRNAYQLLADILRKMDKSDELIPRLKKLSEKDPRNSTLKYFLAEQYVDQGRLEEAEKLYKKTLDESGDTNAYLGLAKIYQIQKKPEKLLDTLGHVLKIEEGLEQLEEVIVTISRDEELLDGLLAAGKNLTEGDQPELKFSQSYLLAKLAAEAEKTEEAVRFYRYAATTRRDRAKVVYQELAQFLMEVQKYGRAAEVYREAIDNPGLNRTEKANFLFLLSRAHELNGATEKALQAVKQSQQLIPQNPLLEYQEGWIYSHSRQWDKAIPVFEKVITDHAAQAQFKRIVRMCQFSLSSIYVQQGDIQKGEEVLEKILAEEPDNVSVNNDLGYLYADQGKKLDKAEKMIRKAVEAEPENAAYLDSMGWVLYKQGEFAEAVKHLEKATSLPDGNDTTIWDHLGDCYDRLDQPAKAREAWNKALKLARDESYPDKKLIERIQQKLKNQKQTSDNPRPERSESP